MVSADRPDLTHRIVHIILTLLCGCHRDKIIHEFPVGISETKLASEEDAEDENFPVYLHKDCSEYWHSELIPYSRRVVSQGIGHVL
jgi:hypothetical protein